MLGGCASNFDVLPEKMGGLPAAAPARATEQAAYPNVYAPSAPRATPFLSTDEQKSVEKELLSLRESQEKRANPPPPPPPAKKQAAKKAPGTKTAEKKNPEKKAADKKPPDKPPN